MYSLFADQQQFYEDNLPSPPHPPVYAYDTTPSDNIPSYDSSPHDTSREFDDSPTPELYHRSKSEALLETNFDFDDSESSPLPMTEASRSYSQPLETAMWFLILFGMHFVGPNVDTKSVFIQWV